MATPLAGCCQICTAHHLPWSSEVRLTDILDEPLAIGERLLLIGSDVMSFLFLLVRLLFLSFQPERAISLAKTITALLRDASSQTASWPAQSPPSEWLDESATAAGPSGRFPSCWLANSWARYVPCRLSFLNTLAELGCQWREWIGEDHYVFVEIMPPFLMALTS